MVLEQTLLHKQQQFIELNPAGGAKLLLGGMGSGKTYALVIQCLYYLQKYKGEIGLVMSLTHPLVWNAMLTPLLSILSQAGIAYKHAGDKKLITVFFDYNKPSYIYYGSYAAGDLVSVNCAWCCLDEYDLCPDAENYFVNNILARVRKGDSNYCNISIGTTPEGLGFTYNYFSEKGEKFDIKNNFKKIIISSVDNPFVDQTTLAMRLRLLSKEKRAAYIYGLWTNLTENTCFYNFNETKVIKINKADYYANAQEIIIGIDFNVSKMVLSISTDVFGLFTTVDEIVRYNSNTPDLMDALKKYKQKHFPNAKLKIYPDYAANSRNTNNKKTDIDVIKNVFPDSFVFLKANPLISDRYAIVNFMFAENKLYISDECQQILRDLRNINTTKIGTFDKNALEKKGLTHAIDAFSYPIYHLYASYFRAMYRQYSNKTVLVS